MLGRIRVLVMGRIYTGENAKEECLPAFVLEHMGPCGPAAAVDAS